jgi:thymidylate synthase
MGDNIMSPFVHRNVNEAFSGMMEELLVAGEWENTRNGRAIVYPEPVLMIYRRPMERVLFNRKRRANPFFHLFEAMWMLAGRRDAAFLDRYVHDFGNRFAESSGALHGAYGHRWRSWVGRGCEDFDQIEWVVDHLRNNPGSRRAVIQMYDPSLDSTMPGVPAPLDIPCNTTIYLRMMEKGGVPTLDLTVCCRSNDAIWGAYGANAVHFTVLQEYLAWRLGTVVGCFHQFSHNLHAYENTLNLYDPDDDRGDLYADGRVKAHALFADCYPVTFAQELDAWLEKPSAEPPGRSALFGELLVPMSIVHDAIREKKWNTALMLCGEVVHTDWREAAVQWIKTRTGGETK